MTGKCSLVKGVTKQPLLLLSSMRSREKQATPRFLRAAGLMALLPIRALGGSIVSFLHAYQRGRYGSFSGVAAVVHLETKNKRCDTPRY